MKNINFEKEDLKLLKRIVKLHDNKDWKNRYSAHFAWALFQTNFEETELKLMFKKLGLSKHYEKFTI